MIIIRDGNTYKIEWSEGKNGWMYYCFYDVEMTDSELSDTDIEEEEGGLCTGSLIEAIEMSGAIIFSEETAENLPS